MEQDYIKRLIEEIGRVLGKIVSDLAGLKTEGQVGEIYQMVSETLKDELDFDIEELISRDDEINFLVNEKSFSHANINMLADIIYLMWNDVPENKQEKLHEKCLVLYEYLQQTSTTYSIDIQQKIETLQNDL